MVCYQFLISGATMTGRLILNFCFIVCAILCFMTCYNSFTSTFPTWKLRNVETCRNGTVVAPTPLHSQEPIPDTGVCTFKYRQHKIRNICDKSPPLWRNVQIGDTNIKRAKEGPAIPVALLHHERKVMGCLISKVATHSWIAYTSSLIPGSVNIPRTHYLTLEDVKNKYAEYKKYIVVRHPLQRLVSAYYETVRKRKRYSNITFRTFMEKLASGEFVDKNEHWALYTSYCFPCEVNYDYILKIETLEDDLRMFSEALGLNGSASLSHKYWNNAYDFKNQSLNPHTLIDGATHYKYDPFLHELAELYPDLFQKVQGLYQKDMDMFGYSWSFQRNSTCGFANSTCC